jgi:hypothetical protein
LNDAVVDRGFILLERLPTLLLKRFAQSLLSRQCFPIPGLEIRQKCGALATTKVFDLRLQLSNLRIQLLHLGRFFSSVNQQLGSLLLKLRKFRFQTPHTIFVSVNKRICPPNALGAGVFTFCINTVLLGFNQLRVKSSESFNDSVLVGIERNDLVVLRVVDQALFVTADLLLELSDAR